MTYLIESNSPQDNFNLMAKGIWGTKEDSVLHNKDGLTRQAKDHKLKVITFLAFSILFCCVGYMNQDPMTFVPILVSAGIAIYEAIKLKQCIKKLADCEVQLKKNFDSLNKIYDAVMQFINEKSQAKANFVMGSNESFGMANDNNKFREEFQSIAVNYDTAHELLFGNGIKSIRENSKAIPKSQGFPIVSKRVWESFKHACNEYATCSLTYTTLAAKYKITEPSLLS